MPHPSLARLARLARLAVVAAILVPAAPLAAEVVSASATGFVIEREIVVAVVPQVAWDAFTGDVMPWWDHHLSPAPKAMYIEPKPGGGFYEIFDDAGNGALHATVTVAKPPQLLRFNGPLGLTGHAVDMVHSLHLEAGDEPGTTRMYLAVRAMGEIQDGWAQLVDRVWEHFLVARFKPYVEGTLEQSAAPPADGG